MEFTVEFYETVTGRCPVREFLDELKASNPDDFAAVLAGLAKLRSRVYHRPPLSKFIGDDLFELRHVQAQYENLVLLYEESANHPCPWNKEKDESALGARSRDCAGEKKGLACEEPT
jgi:hypothetical protein